MNLDNEAPDVIPIVEEGERQFRLQLNKLRAAVKAQVCRYTIENVLTSLTEYAGTHFREEELLMDSLGYPDYLPHKKMHGRFATELQFLKEELRSIKALGLRGSYELSVETIQLVTDWLAGHVMQNDRRLGEFLLARSVANTEER